MFVFGDPQEIASMIFEEGSKKMGPGAPQVDLDEMSTVDLRTTLTYCRIAYLQAVRDGATDEVVQCIVDAYDDVFTRLCEASDDFRNLVLDGGHHYLEGFNEAQVTKYHGIAGSKP